MIAKEQEFDVATFRAQELEGNASPLAHTTTALMQQNELVKGREAVDQKQPQRGRRDWMIS